MSRFQAALIGEDGRVRAAVLVVVGLLWAACVGLDVFRVTQFGLAGEWPAHVLFLTLVAAAATLWREPAQRVNALLLALAAVGIHFGSLQGLSQFFGGYWDFVGWSLYWWASLALYPVFLSYPGTRLETRGPVGFSR